MGINLPQLAPASTDRVSGASIIDGSLKFGSSQDASGPFLSKTPGSAGDRKTWTLSCWIKRNQISFSPDQRIFTARAGDGNGTQAFLKITSADVIQYLDSLSSANISTTAVFRDTGWYHLTVVLDAAKTGLSIYINGEEQILTGTQPSNADGSINNNILHAISYDYFSGGTGEHTDTLMSQFYFIDGLKLGPGYFGYTDPLTGTWRPKRFSPKGTTVNDGTVWTNKMSNTSLIYAGTAANVYNGNITPWTTDNYASYNSGVLTLLTGVNIKVKSSIRIYGNWLDTDYIVINGVNYLTNANGGQKWISPIGVSYPLNLSSLAIDSTPGGLQNSLSGVEIDGVIMQDSTTQNLDFGTNGWYLPFDGSAPIGQDQSGKSNNYTPSNFGGSNTIEKATGALPILNTVDGGTVARPGVFGNDVSSTIAVTVSNSTGNNKYYFDSILNPSLAFIRGGTITFDTTDSSNNSHPFKLSSTNADSSSGTEYTDGVAYYINGSTVSGSDYVSNYATNGGGTGFRGIKWTIPHNVSTTYYYCTVHPGMGNNGRLTSTTDETKADPYAWKNVLALPLVGQSADVSNQINCTSTTNTITNSGVDFLDTYGNFYSRSGDFTGATSDVLSTASDNTKYQMGTDDFTCECWIYSTSTSGTQNVFQVFAGGSKYYGIYWNGSSLRFYIAGSGGAEISAGDVVMGTNRWIHVALVRDSGTLRAFIGGTQVVTGSVSANIDEDGYVAYVGRHQPSNNGFTGYMQDFRIYRGVAKYTNNFIPASTDPDILPDSPSGIATKSKLTKITEGAISFTSNGVATGQSDYLNAGTSSDFTIGSSGNFTVECFIYPTSVSDTAVFGIGASSQLGYRIINGSPYMYVGSSGGVLNTGTIPKDKWTHIAVTRSGGTLYSFIDGVLADSVANTTAISASGGTGEGFFIGAANLSAASPPQYGFTGQISNFRFINGIALYTSDFAVPTAPLTNVTNTKLLCCQSNTSTGSAAVAPNISGANDGTVWSERVTSGSQFRSGYGPENAFDGNTVSSISGTTACQINEVSFVEFDWGEGIPFTTLQMQCDDNNEGTVILTGANGDVDITSQLPTGSFTNTTITGVTSPLKKLRMNAVNANASSIYLGSITIDGVILVDPVLKKGSAEATNFNPANTDINTVRGQEGSYCTWSPLTKTGGALSNGNLKFIGSNAWQAVKGAFSVSSGKWYYEATVFGTTYGTAQGNVSFGIGWHNAENPPSSDNIDTASNYVNVVCISNNGWWNNFGGMQSSITSMTEGDVIGVALDKDNNTFEFYKNGVSILSRKLANTTVDLSPWNNCYYTNSFYESNFGQKPFKFTPPDGYQPLTSSATSRSDTIITRPDQFVGVTTYVGNGGTQSINTSMEPDLVWIKNRDEAISNMLYDTVRGNNQYLRSDTNDAQDTGSSNQLSFNSKGFTLTGAGGGVNKNNIDFVAWTWKAGGNKNTFNIDGVGYSSLADAGLGIGSKNSDAYNTSGWVAATTVTNLYGSHNLSSIYNGNYGHIHATSGNTLTLTWLPGTIKGRVRVLLRNAGSPGNHQYKDANGTAQDLSASSSRAWFDLGDIDLTYLSAPHPSGGNAAMVEAIELDGKVLVDSGQTPPDMPTEEITGCSIGTKQGFSIIQHTGDGNTGSLPHGLTKAPEFFITKVYSGTTGNWNVYMNFIDGSNDYLYVNSTQSKGDSSLNPALPTVFYIGYTSNSYIHYCWHSVPGLQKFGIYAGNGSSSGPMLELGFRPAVILLKKIDNTDSNSGWHWYDSKRNKQNTMNNFLLAGHGYVENRAANNTATVTSYTVDFLSNGFRLSHSSNNLNDSGSNYLYAAWAEAPQFNLFGATSNAR